MIYGIGTDLLDMRRIEKSSQAHPFRLAKKVLSEQEMSGFEVLDANIRQRTNYLAKRWAAKEAFSKACGTGIRAPVLFPNISISNDSLGKPIIVTHNDLSVWVAEQSITQIQLSLSDEPPMVIAFVILACAA